uniref:Reverse transcriptase domain-containing protein n=1 Tax=Nicotiana tabacum TaxID=4097 RepID=A0A1S3YQI9_TOBAC|nr:PREDICTED: uncharacterized protein LOC107778702 [Nicotiana tabacum]
MDLEEIAKNEEISWRQKSRVQWLKQGDRNTKFFRRVANANMRFNTVDRLNINGTQMEDLNTIKAEILSFYQQLYKEPEEWRPDFNYPHASKINESEVQWLQREFDEQEILEGLRACAADKAPGPDGYTMGFFLHCWELVGAGDLKDYMPISLIGSLYKIISKVLTERLKKVIYKLVDEQQMAFIKGRQIMDASLIANECVDSTIKEKIPGILCKLDIEKAFDHINWSFLLKLLKDLGFGIKWIQFCITNVRFSILINGSPEGFFPSQRG